MNLNINKKMKTLTVLLFAAAYFCSLAIASAGHLEDIAARGTIRIGTTGDYIPMSYLNPKTGEYEGIDAELSKIIADSLGVKIEYVKTTCRRLRKTRLQENSTSRFAVYRVIMRVKR